MKVYIQANRQGMPYSVNGYMAMDGFYQMGFMPRLFTNLAEISPDLERPDIVVGGIRTVQTRLADLGVDWSEINYSPELLPYLGRKIWHDTMDNINAHPEKWPVFVKSLVGKQTVSRVIRGPHDLVGMGSSYENIPVLCSEVVDFVAEWRVFVRYGQILGVKPYWGDWHCQFDPAVIENCLAAYHTAKAGYSIDFGVDRRGQTLLVEVNDGYSLGAYGLDNIAYAKLLAARWAELTGTPDECAFDQ